MLARVFCLSVICVLYSSSLLAEVYVREYTYKASEADSKITSRTIAIDQVKVLLLQEIGTIIHHEINMTKNGKGNTYASEDVEAITAGMTKFEILEEKWDGYNYYLKAKIEADTKNVLNMLDEYKKANSEDRRQQLEALKTNQRMLKNARKEISSLKKQLKNAKNSSQQKILIEKYIEEVDEISVTDLYKKGLKLAKAGKYSEAHPILLKAALRGDAGAQAVLGIMYASGYGVERDEQAAINWYRKSAFQGDAGSQNNLGWMHLKGLGVEKDYLQAVVWFRKSAEQGEEKAQYSLAEMYSSGIGVRANERKAFKLYKQAAEQGDSKAQFKLGMFFDSERILFIGIDDFYDIDDDGRAFGWYKRAAEQGHKDAKLNLAWLYFDGRGVEPNKQRAVELFHELAENNHVTAQYVLGNLYKKGNGIKQDEILSKEWFKKACINGDKEACK